MNTLKPPALKKGDTIGIVAPSFPFPFPEKPSNSYYDWYLKGKNEIESMGFFLKEGRNLRKTKWWTAGTAQERASDINDMFADPKVQAIIAHDGGFSAITILEYLDYNLISRNPKPLIGFSDITNFHVALFAKTGLIGFHMGLLNYSLGRIWNIEFPREKKPVRAYFHDILTSHKPLGMIEPITSWKSWKKGTAQGRLLGGSLSLFCSLLGSRYFPTKDQLNNAILFWEMDDTPNSCIERCLYQLKYAGVLDSISGMIVGKLHNILPTGWEGMTQPSPQEIVLDVCKDYTFPILGNVDFGHETLQIPMPIGIDVYMNAENVSIEYLESAVV